MNQTAQPPIQKYAPNTRQVITVIRQGMPRRLFGRPLRAIPALPDPVLDIEQVRAKLALALKPRSLKQGKQPPEDWI